MAIVDMTEFRLTLFAKDRDRLLERIQDFDQVHIRTLDRQAEEEWGGRIHAADTGKSVTAVNEEMGRAQEALDILSAYVVREKGLKEKFSNRLPSLSLEETKTLVKEEGALAAIEDTLRLREAIRHSQERMDQLKEEKKQLDRWKTLDLPLGDLQKPKKVKVSLGTLPSRWMDEARKFLASHAQRTYMEFLSADDKTAYVMVISDGTDPDLDSFFRDINFTPVHFEGEETVESMIREREAGVGEEKKNIAQVEVELKKLARDKKVAIEAYYELQSYKEDRLEAEGKTLESEKITFLEGFVPTDRAQEFKQVVTEELPDGRFELETGEADREDPDVPILLRNNGLVTPFENLVETYSMPLYKEMDPTGLLAPWYMLFFGLMMGDAGYGALMLLATSFALHYFDFKPSTARSIRFFQILSVPTILAGLAFGSIFGGLIPMDPLIINPQVEIMPMIVFSVILGIVCIFVALGLGAVQSVREGDPAGAVWDYFSWYFLIGGLIVGGLSKAFEWNSMVSSVAFIFAIIGALLIIFFSARDEKSTGARIAWGAYNLYGATGYIGDFASFTRVTALMLSGAYIGFSFNLIGRMIMGIVGSDASVWEALGQGQVNIFMFIIAMVLLVFLHLFNLFLSALSAYVHSMRLIYVEYFGKFYQGGGKRFKKLRPEGKYLDIK